MSIIKSKSRRASEARARQAMAASRNTKNGKPYRVTELFSGIGAQRMALMEKGIPHEVVATSDVNKFSLQSYEAIYGDNPNLGDITKVSSIPDSDILTYSFPCTDLSVANAKKKGMAKGADSRSSLVWEVQRLLEDAKQRGALPEWLIMENVPAILGKKNRTDFNEWVAYLDSLGYTSRWGVLNAKDFGVPQNRERAFMLSHLGPDCPDLPVGPGSTRVLEDVLESDVPENYYLSKARMKGLEESNKKEKAKGNGFRFEPVSRDGIAHTVTTRAGSRKTDNFVYDHCHQVGELDIKGYDCIKRVYSPDGLSPTCPRGAGGNHLPKITEDGKRVRKLTPRETWRLQGFPDWAFDRAAATGMSDTRLYEQAGNSLAVPVMGAIMETIDRYDIEASEGRSKKKARRTKLDDYGGDSA